MIVDTGEQFFDRRLDDVLSCDVELLGDLIPEFDAEAGESAVFFEYEWFDDPRGYFELLLRWLGEDAGDGATRKDNSDKPNHCRYR